MSAEMMAAAIGEVVSVHAAAPVETSPLGKVGATHTDFSRLVSEGLASVNQQLLTSEASLGQLASGNVENLHQVMIQLEESKLSFQLLLQIRTRLLEAYQDVMRMQV